ncbi:hypothetical protein FRB90_002286 [Tulasnella sp. 427]|nr:hypothetical protein FRB90_002286 [Tulasnella sp. 427]
MMDVPTILPIVPLIGCVWAFVNDLVILKGMVSVLICILYIREHPTNEELVHFLQKIEELESQLQKTTRWLANFSNLVQLPLLSTTTLRLPSDNGPFDRIPLEVTTAILDEALRELGPIVVGELDEARLSIALTCRLWADVFFGNPVWWTVIRTDFGVMIRGDWNRQLEPAAALKSALKRSKSLPLEWTVGPWTGWMSIKDLIPVQASRLKSLTIENASRNRLFVSTIVEFPLPQLRCFKMRGGLISDFELDAPNLKELEFVNDFHLGTIRFAQATRPAIQTLHIEGSWDDFVRLLSEFSQTVEFLTGVDLGTRQLQPASPLFLPSLRAFCLRGWCESFPLYVTNVPLLEKITFVNWTVATIDISPHQHALPVVHTVEWTHRLESEDLHDLRQILTSVTPSVYTLILERNESDPQATTDSTPNRRLVRVLLNVNMYPKLQELHIRGRSWLTVSNIKQIVAARLGNLRRVTVERVGRGQDTPPAARAAVKYLRENLEELHIPSEEEWVGAFNEAAE